MKVIAYYLPQFHPFPENDEWWGKGFTEWTNVGKAKPLFKGHYQPKIPADLGYYDLRLPQVREQQVELAKEAGISGFCYWHYWFGNGKRLMADIFNEVLETGKPDFPFCLAWANHSWYAKNWNSEGIHGKDRLLIAQTYPGIEDARMHFEYLLKAFKDSRYIKIENKPLLVIFDPKSLPSLYIDKFQQWSKESGFSEGIHLVAILRTFEEKKDYIEKGFSSVTYIRQGEFYSKKTNIQKIIFHLNASIKHFLYGCPRMMFSYKKAIPYLINKADYEENVIPTILPNWDHTPRSGNNGSLLQGSTPELFKTHVDSVLRALKGKKNAIAFLKSWNEWGEGNYMEPDLRFGKKYIEMLASSLNEFSDEF